MQKINMPYNTKFSIPTPYSSQYNLYIPKTIFNKCNNQEVSFYKLQEFNVKGILKESFFFFLMKM